MNPVSRLVCAAAALVLVGCGESDSTAASSDVEDVERIFADLDNRSLTVAQQLENYTDDAVILVPDQREIRGRSAVSDHLSDFGQDMDIATRHEIVELSSFEDLVVVQGRVVGTAQPDGEDIVYPFETKNVILFKRELPDGLKVWKVIYNSAPVSDAESQL